jgi:hypothetical protein
MGDLLDKQYQFFVQNKQELLDKYEGKFIVIHDEELVGNFNTEKDAYVYCVTHFKIGTFFIHQVEAED